MIAGKNIFCQVIFVLNKMANQQIKRIIKINASIQCSGGKNNIEPIINIIQKRLLKKILEEENWL